jgi:hypothetical protein
MVPVILIPNFGSKIGDPSLGVHLVYLGLSQTIIQENGHILLRPQGARRFSFLYGKFKIGFRITRALHGEFTNRSQLESWRTANICDNAAYLISGKIGGVPDVSDDHPWPFIKLKVFNRCIENFSRLPCLFLSRFSRIYLALLREEYGFIGSVSGLLGNIRLPKTNSGTYETEGNKPYLRQKHVSLNRDLAIFIGSCGFALCTLFGILILRRGAEDRDARLVMYCLLFVVVAILGQGERIPCTGRIMGFRVKHESTVKPTARKPKKSQPPRPYLEHRVKLPTFGTV